MAKISIDKDLCKNCLICVDVCPRKVYVTKDMIEEGRKVPFPENADKCSCCRVCELFCPDFAITVSEKK